MGLEMAKQTTSLECQIAREQLKRYMSGAKLTPELVRGLERHLNSCPECLAIARKNKREAAPAKKPVATHALIDAAKTAVSKPTASKRTAMMRSGILGGTLVLTLIAMGAISRDPSTLLGPRAIQKAEAKAAAPVVTEFEEPMRGEPLAMIGDQPIFAEAPVEQEPTPEEEPQVVIESRPKPQTPKPRTNRTPRRAPAQASKPATPPTTSRPQSQGGSVRVYDASGRPVNPN